MDKKELIRLLEERWITKEELQSLLGMNERGVRLVLADLNIELGKEGRCVLSSAGRRGYHIPSVDCDEDIEWAVAVEKELESKAISIFERRKAIRCFLNRAGSRDRATYVQGSLF